MIDITNPRECVYQQFEEQPGPCPRCGGPLQSHKATYLVDTRSGRKRTDSFFIGNDMSVAKICSKVRTGVESVSLAYWLDSDKFQKRSLQATDDMGLLT